MLNLSEQLEAEIKGLNNPGVYINSDLVDKPFWRMTAQELTSISYKMVEVFFSKFQSYPEVLFISVEDLNSLKKMNLLEFLQIRDLKIEDLMMCKVSIFPELFSFKGSYRYLLCEEAYLYGLNLNAIYFDINEEL